MKRNEMKERIREKWNERMDGTCTWLFGRFSAFMRCIPPNQSINQSKFKRDDTKTQSFQIWAPKHNSIIQWALTQSGQSNAKCPRATLARPRDHSISCHCFAHLQFPFANPRSPHPMSANSTRASSDPPLHHSS